SNPEQQNRAQDCYTCGETVDPQVAIDYLVSVLKPEKTYAKKLVRGIGELQVIEPEIKVAEVVSK
ncbi:S-adenosylmethionine decarboxylase proenzyme, partial [Mesorhizobium sp. M00.F.Ca.ET.186.01.1.1]